MWAQNKISFPGSKDESCERSTHKSSVSCQDKGKSLIFPRVDVPASSFQGQIVQLKKALELHQSVWYYSSVTLDAVSLLYWNSCFFVHIQKWNLCLLGIISFVEIQDNDLLGRKCISSPFLWVIICALVFCIVVDGLWISPIKSPFPLLFHCWTNYVLQPKLYRGEND